jgi:DNA polymerase III subunit epsilon
MINKACDRILFIDTETGGIDPQKHSLLSIGLVVWEPNKGILDSIQILIKSSEYIITKEAQNINKFDRETHDMTALKPQVVIECMINFIRKYFEENQAIPLAGHNTQFDINFLKRFLDENGRSFGSIFSHRIIDTYSILRYLYYCGRIDQNIASSSEAFRFFNIQVDSRHTALGDAIATAKLFEAMMKLIM